MSGQSDKPAYELTHVRHDTIHCLAPGLFRAMPRGKRPKLDVQYVSRDGRTQATFRGPDALGADDLRTLQFLTALAGPTDRGAQVERCARTPSGQMLRQLLQPFGDACEGRVVLVRTTPREALRETGMSWSRRQGTAFLGSLRRLSEVTVRVSRDSYESGGSRLLSYVFECGHGHKGKVAVELNYLVSSAVLGGHHIRMSMEEVRALHGADARLIHQRLCAWINPGKRRPVKIETLVGYLHPPDLAAGNVDRRAKSKRVKAVRAALDELVRIGWNVAEFGAGRVGIMRPRTGD